MARDFKDRGQDRRQKRRGPDRRADGDGTNLLWIIFAVVAFLFTVFLGYRRFTTPKVITEVIQEQVVAPEEKEKKEPPAPARLEPKFEYFTILPEAEVVVPEHEFKTRMREERIGKVKSMRYILQVGSYREMADAEKLKTDLANMGITSKIEKAKVGEVIWHRVKLGPYAQLSLVEMLKQQLRDEGIDVIITEVPK